MPRPKSFDTDAVAAAALAVIDRDGLDGLSMRTLAAELGLRTMSIYRYVESRSEVEQLVVRTVLADLDLDLDLDLALDGTWGDRVAALVERMHAAAARHPAATPLLLAHRHVGESSWGWGEAVLAALTEGGLTGQHRVIALRALQSYLDGAIQLQRFGPLDGSGTLALAELPAEPYPLLTTTALDSRGLTPRDEFRRGLVVLIRGLGGEVSPHPTAGTDDRRPPATTRGQECGT